MKKLTDKQKDEIIKAAVLLKLLHDTPFSEFTERTRPIWRKNLGSGWKLWMKIPNPDKFLFEEQPKPAAGWFDQLKLWFSSKVVTS